MSGIRSSAPPPVDRKLQAVIAAMDEYVDAARRKRYTGCVDVRFSFNSGGLASIDIGEMKHRKRIS